MLNNNILKKYSKSKNFFRFLKKTANYTNFMNIYLVVRESVLFLGRTAFASTGLGVMVLLGGNGYNE